MSEDEKLTEAVAETKRRFHWQLTNLVRRCEVLKKHLESVVRECELALADKAFAINENGVVRSSGLEIDQLCAVIACQREQMNLLAWVVKKDD